MKLLQFLSTKSEQPLGGRYKLIEPLGKGGFGCTFLATDLHLPDHPTCVIKQLKPHLQDAESMKTARRLFDTEARVLYRLGEHPQIPRLLAHFEDKQEFYLAQELVDGDTLAQLIKPGQAWSAPYVLNLLHDILTPLAFVHQQGVIHRDLKPSNLIRRSADGRIVLIDFGAVKQVSDQQTYVKGEATRTISIGTQGYMPNEQLAGKPWFCSDIFAVGMIALQALTGVAPHLFKRDPRSSEIVWQPPHLEISDEFAEILSRMVRYDFRERYPTAADALAALQALPEAPAARPTEASLSAELQADLSTLMAAPAVPLAEPSASSSASPSPATVEGAAAVPDTAETGADPETGAMIGPEIKASQRPPSLLRSQVTKTVAAAKLGLPTVTKSVQTTSETVIAALPASLRGGHPPSRRVAIVGVGILAVIGLGSARNWIAPPDSPAPEVIAASEEKASAQPVQSGSAESASAEPASTQTDSAEPASTQPDSVQSASAEPASTQSASTQSASAKPASAKPAAARPVSTQTPAQPASAQPTAGDLLIEAADLRDRKQYKAALSAYDQALALGANTADAHWGRCYSLNQMQTYDQALEACDRALAIAPDHIQALWSKGHALEQQNQLEAALALYQQTVELAPDYSEAWNNRGVVQQKLQRSQQAVASFDQALALNPDFAEAWSNRGAALWSLRQFDAAIVSIDKAIQLQPDYSEALELRQQIRQKLGR
ncbi:MAG: tetratricopeptide repeat protein [Cyanobacteria bacterium P01_A01_bin.114]